MTATETAPATATSRGDGGAPWRASPGAVAGLLLVCAGFAILMGIITAEALYSEVYTTHDNEISDLGATRPPDSVSYQPSAGIFNATMVGSGLLLLGAGGLLHRAFASRRVTISMLVLGAGMAGVGVFPGNYEVAHPLAALTTFIAAGVASILSAHVQRGWMRYVSIVLGAITLGTLMFAIVGESTRVFEEMGSGGIERWVAYPAVAWLLGFGGYLGGARDRGARD